MTCFSTSSQFQFAKILVSFSTFDFELLGTKYLHTKENSIATFSQNLFHIRQFTREIDMTIKRSL